MQKKHLSDFIDKEIYSKWLTGKKVIIHGPTGMGKSHFVINDFVPYCSLLGKKVLIWCNRKLLREQYHYDLTEQYPRYQDMAENVQVITYQEVAERLKNGNCIRPYLDGFDVLVLDEVHYFYADSDFNALGTYVLLQVLIKEAFLKTMIFLTATLKETYPLLEKTLHKCAMKMELENPELDLDKYKFHGEIHDFTYLADYERFTCHYVPDLESLAEEIANSPRKSVIFIDDTALAKQFKAQLLKSPKVTDTDIYLLSSQILDERASDTFIRELCIANTLQKKILITTSVLDNGVSIHDPEVGNLVIATESRVSFIQMIGRVRGEQVESCRLFVFPRDSSYYEKRVSQYEERIQYFKQLEQIPLQKNAFGITATGWYGTDDKVEFLRNSVVYTKNEWDYYTYNPLEIRLRYPDPILAINAFAKEKIGNMLQSEKNFLRKSYQNKAAVAQEQVKWIGKDPDELVILESSYIKKREDKLIEELLKVQDYSLQELKEFKTNIAKEFRRDLLEGIITKDQSFETKKLEQICEKYGLTVTKADNSSGKNSYSIYAKQNNLDIES